MIKEDLAAIFEEIQEKWEAQNLKREIQDHPVRANFSFSDALRRLQELKDINKEKYQKSWYSILAKEVLEAFTEINLKKQREEMIQVAAVAVAIIERLDQKLKEEGE